MKRLTTTLAIMLTISTTAQPYLGMGINNRGAAIHAGALVSDLVEVNLTYNTRVSNKADKPSSLTLNAGLKLILAEDEQTQLLLTPSLGYSNTKYQDFSNYETTGEIIKVNANRVNYSLELAKQRNGVRLFVNGSYALKGYVGVGAKIFIN